MYEIDPAPIKDVYLYLRKSRKSKNRQVRSIEDQKVDCLVLAEQLGLNVIHIFEEKGSARHPYQRPIYSEMIKKLSYKSPERRQADGILSWHPNRLSRNAEESGKLVQRIDDKLIKHLYFPAYSFHNDSSGIEHLSMELVRAKGYSDQLSDSVSRGVQGREKEGAMVYPVRFGYMKKREYDDPSHCSLFPIPHPDFFKVRQRIITLGMKGYSINQIEAFIKEEFHHLLPLPLSHSSIQKILTDEFNYGKWIVNPNKDNERVIDLNSIKLADGTQFTPICSEIEFFELQKKRGKSIPYRKTRRINPLPAIVTCNRCSKKMYPTYRKIKRKGGVIEEQLGYECQFKDDNGKKCEQPRVKAQYLLDYVEGILKKQTTITSEHHYQAYLFALKSFVNKKKQELKSHRSSQSKKLSTLLKKKETLIHQKVQLLKSGSLDSITCNHIDDQLQDMQTQIQDAKHQKSNSQQDSGTQIRTFCQFLELTENLHHYWANADLAKKGDFAKLFLLNLSIETREVQSHKCVALFSETEKLYKTHSGRGACMELELFFTSLWDRLFTHDSQQIKRQTGYWRKAGLDNIKPQYPINSCIANIP